MASTEYISLDWRNAPTAEVIIDRLLTIFNDLDVFSQVSMRLSNSTTAAIVHSASINGVKAFRRNGRQTKRKANTPKLATYFSDLWEVTKTLQAMQVDEQALKGRFIAYIDVKPERNMSLAYVRRLIIDLALTIKVHPLALGIKGEVSGEVYIPEGVHINIRLVTNTFEYNKRDPTVSGNAKKWCKDVKLSVGTHTILEPVLDLKVIITSTSRVDAVVVVEHRNLASVMTENRFAIEHIIIVMTSGCPDSATKEHLHQLSKNERIRNVPFLYYSDHDNHGIDIFKTLKYGSKKAAWASDISICPQLVWVGPTLNEYLDSPKEFRQQWIEAHKEKHQSETDAQAARAADKWQKNAEASMKKKLVALNRKDQEMIRAFRSGGWLEDESRIQNEIAQMEEKPSKFRMANLADFDVRYLRQYIETTLLQYCTVRTKVPGQKAAALSTRQQAFADAASQSQLSNLQSAQDMSQALATQRELPDAETVNPAAVFEEVEEALALGLF